MQLAEGGKMGRRLVRGIMPTALALLLVTCNGMAQPAPTEYEVKAAFLYNFARFVEWPSSSFPNALSQFRICILGQDPFGSALLEITRDKWVNLHQFKVEDIASVQEARTCQILFVSSSEYRKTQQILEGLHGTSVLTVGDTKGFAERGGMIDFMLEDDRVHFEVNFKMAEQAGLKISSKLLSVAKLVSS
jgi:YfiR/HmsC-like